VYTTTSYLNVLHFLCTFKLMVEHLHSFSHYNYGSESLVAYCVDRRLWAGRREPVWSQWGDHVTNRIPTPQSAVDHLAEEAVPIMLWAYDLQRCLGVIKQTKRTEYGQQLV
jgi:hypothetical protein